jgi:hypothetical protein
MRTKNGQQRCGEFSRRAAPNRIPPVGLLAVTIKGLPLPPQPPTSTSTFEPRLRCQKSTRREKRRVGQVGCITANFGLIAWRIILR